MRFLQPLICSQAGKEFCTELKAGEDIKDISVEIFRFDIMSALTRGLPVDYGAIKREDFGSLGFALKPFSKESGCKFTRSGDVISLNLGKIPQNGTYLIRAGSGAEEAYQLFSVSDIGLVNLCSFNQDGGSCFWVSDLRTGAGSVPDRAVKFSAQKGVCENGVNIGGGGLADAKAEAETVLYAFRKGEQTALFLAAPVESCSGCWQGFLTCETRTLRPGQNLSYRAVLRKAGPYKAESSDSKEVFTAELRGSDNKTVCSDKTALDFDNCINGMLKIPKELEDRSYTLVLRDSRGAAAASYEFDSVGASEQQLSLNAGSDKAFYGLGDAIVLELELQDKDKLPVGAADLKIQAKQCEADFAGAYGYGCLGLQAVSAFKPCPLIDGFVKTDAAGKAVFKLNAKDLNLNDGKCHVVRFNISSEDGKASASCSFLLTPKPYYLQIVGGEDLCSGDKGNFYIQCNDWQGNALSGAEAEISISGKDGKALQSLQLKTDERGQAAFAYDFTEGGDYTVRAEINNISSAASKAPSAEIKKHFAVRAKAEPLHLKIQDSFCLTGEETVIKTELPAGGGDVLLVLENSGFFRRYVFHTDKNELSFKIPARADMFPSVNVRVFCVSGGRLYSDSKSLSVCDPDRFVKLSAALESLPVKGRNGKIKVKAFDSQGRPAHGNVQLALINTEDKPIAADENFLASVVLEGRRRGDISENTNLSRNGLSEVKKASEPPAVFSGYRHIDLGSCRLGEDGLGEIEAEMPDLQGKWTLIAYTFTNEGYIGFNAADVNIFENLSLSAEGPSVLNGGDFAEYKIKLRNTCSESLKLQIGLHAQKQSILHLQLKGGSENRGGVSYVPEFELAPNAVKELECIVKGGLPGSDNIVVVVKSSKGADKYHMPIVIQPMVTVYDQNRQASLKGETVLEFDKFKPEFIGRVFDRSLNLGLMNGLGGVLALNAENLRSRESRGCTDEVLAEWAVPVICAPAFSKYNLDIPEGLKLSPSQDEDCRRLLSAARNSDGGCAWYKGLKSDPVMTAQVLLYSRKLKNLGLDGLDEMIGGAEKYLHKAADKAPLNMRMLYYLALPDLELNKDDAQKIERLGKEIDTPAILCYIQYLIDHQQNSKALALWSKLAARQQNGEETACFRGNEAISGCQTTALALMIGISLELQDEELEPFVNWLMGERENGLWRTPGDTLAALEALAQLMRRSFSPPGSPSYGVWINGNEIETGDSLNEKNCWYRRINLKVSQLPDSNLRVKFVKNGKEKIWVEAYESLVVHGFKEAGYFNNITGETVNDPAKAPFFIENGWQEIGKKDKPSFVKEGDKGYLLIKITSRVNLNRVKATLPSLGGFTPYKLLSPGGVNCVFDRQGGCIYINSLPKGEYRFKVEGRISECGEFTASPARLQPAGNPDEYAQAEPFAVTAERSGD